MAGDSRLGAVLRELRTVRGLTLTMVARQAGCDLSLISYVETGRRQLQPWLAGKLDQIYGTGCVVTSLTRGVGDKLHDDSDFGVARADVFVVALPQGGVAMPLSRRELLTTLGLGVVTGKLQGEFERALDNIEFDSDLLQFFDDAYSGFKEAMRIIHPTHLIDGMTGNIAILNGLHRRATGEDRRRCCVLQARYAELLSWLSEEAGDLPAAIWWIDRASHWAQAANWPGIMAWSFIRRASMVKTFSGHGLQIIDQAQPVLDMPQASPRMKGWAAYNMGFGYALAGNREESKRALDTALGWLIQPVREDDILLGQCSAVADDLFTAYHATCDIYLGLGARVIPTLKPRLESLADMDFRMGTIARARLVRAYANAGQPAEACQTAWETINAMEQIGSLNARSELRRVIPVLNQWHGRSDVQDIVHRLDTSPP